MPEITMENGRPLPTDCRSDGQVTQGQPGEAPPIIPNAQPRVWIGCLGCYGGSNLIGEWFDALTCPTDELTWSAAIWPDDAGDATRAKRMHVSESHEELWVMDHEGFAGLLSGECSLMEAQRIAQWMDEHDGLDLVAFGAFRSYHGEHYVLLDDDGVAQFEEAYQGEHDSEEDFAQQLADDLGLVDESAAWPNSYIDWERATRELFMGDYWSARSTGSTVYVFRSV
jgi:antirestriction protein